MIGDKPTNSLIVMSSGRDFIAIKDVIRRLDQPRRQIFIEALILEVQLVEGPQPRHELARRPPGRRRRRDLCSAACRRRRSSRSTSRSLAAATGLIGGLIGSPLTNSQTFLGTSIPSYGVLFQALATQDNSNILSAPHIIAIDNEKAEFSVGNNIPYKAGLIVRRLRPAAAGRRSSSPGSIGQNIQREKLNLTLNVTPHISSNDAVRLEIEQETKDIGGQDPELGPTWTERKLKTQVVVHDQQSVVIGGLIQERDIYNDDQGAAARRHPDPRLPVQVLDEEQEEDEPPDPAHAVHHQGPARPRGDPRAQGPRARASSCASFATLNEMKYEPKIDYRRKRGLVEEINRAVQSVEQDLEMLARDGRAPAGARGRARVRAVGHRRAGRAGAGAAAGDQARRPSRRARKAP